MLIKPDIAQTLLAFDFPLIDTGIDTVSEMSIAIVGGFYLIASIFNLYVPDTGVDHKPLKKNPVYLIHEFNHCLMLLWRDRLGQISLAVTTLFWGAGATLQFIVIKWAEVALGLDLSKSSHAAGRRRRRRRHRCRRRRPGHHAAQVGAGDPARHRDGHHRAGDELRHRTLAGGATADPDRRTCRASSSCR